MVSELSHQDLFAWRQKCPRGLFSGIQKARSIPSISLAILLLSCSSTKTSEVEIVLPGLSEKSDQTIQEIQETTGLNFDSSFNLKVRVIKEEATRGLFGPSYQWRAYVRVEGGREDLQAFLKHNRFDQSATEKTDAERRVISNWMKMNTDLSGGIPNPSWWTPTEVEEARFISKIIGGDFGLSITGIAGRIDEATEVLYCFARKSSV